MENIEDKKDLFLVLGQNIRRARERKNLDIKELANRIHYDRVCLSRMEYGEQNITYKTAIKIAAELDVSFPALFSRNYLSVDTEGFREDNFLLVFIENIKRELKVNGMLQTHIYIECGIQESSISRLLSGKIKNPTLGTLCKIASAVTDGNMTRLFSRNIIKEVKK